MKKQSVPADKIFDFLQIAFAYYKQTAITPSKYYFFYDCLTPHGWQDFRKKPYIRCSTVLKIYYIQLLNNFESSVNLQTGLLMALKYKNASFSPLLYARRIETDHLNHIWAGKQNLPWNMKV